MNRSPISVRKASAVLRAVLACVCLAAIPTHAQTAVPPRPPAPAADPSKAYAALREPTAALLFLDARTRQFLPAPTAELRAAGEAAMASGVPGAVDPDVVYALQVTHRVRSGLNLGLAFLNEVRATTGARRLAVVDLLFDTGRVQAAGRLLDTADGRLLAAGTVEPALWTTDDNAWIPAVNQVVTDLLLQISRRPANAGGEPLVVLPVRARGFNRADAVTATHTLLETVLGDDRFSLTDPGVLHRLLVESGHDPRRVDASGMTALADSLGAGRMLAADLISYDAREGRVTAAAAALDDRPSVRTVLPPFSYQIRLTDLTDGGVLDVATLFRDRRPDEGWFGIVHTRSTRSVLRDAAQQLWFELGFHTEASP